MKPTAPAHLLAPLASAVVLAASACSGGEGSEASTWQAERDTIGDTVVVRTVAGSVWGVPRRLVPESSIGEMEGADEYMLGNVGALAVDSAGHVYVFDSQVPALRVYDADGRFVRTIGRQGEGPGEYKQPDAGLAVLPDGRILLRDPGNARINVYAPSGETLEAWPIRGGFFTSYPQFSGPPGHTYVYVWGPRSGSGSALVELSPDGEPLDTLPVPRWDYEAPTISARSGGSSQTWNVPFSPTGVWTWSPEGYFVGGLSTRYAFDIMKPDGSVLRIERSAEPVAVTAGEKATEEHRATQAMRGLDPSWRWNGPPIPDSKPPFRRIYAGVDGRIWVLLHAPGREVPAAADAPSSEPGEPSAPPRWTEPIVFDVFEPDGRYLGRVRGPDGLQTYPYPVFGTDRVWAVVADDLGVEQVVRFALVEGGVVE